MFVFVRALGFLRLNLTELCANYFVILHRRLSAVIYELNVDGWTTDAEQKDITKA